MYGTDIVHQNNFTWTYSTVTIKTDEFNNEELNISYTYTNGSTAWTAAQNSALAISNLSEWEGTIATVIAAVVIIGLLMAGFGAFLMIKGGGV